MNEKSQTSHQSLDKQNQKSWFCDLKGGLNYANECRDGLVEVVEKSRYDELFSRLHDPGKCNTGHETLPLTLWECPECVEEIRREKVQLEKTRLILATRLAELFAVANNRLNGVEITYNEAEVMMSAASQLDYISQELGKDKWIDLLKKTKEGKPYIGTQEPGEQQSPSSEDVKQLQKNQENDGMPTLTIANEDSQKNESGNPKTEKK